MPTSTLAGHPLHPMLIVAPAALLPFGAVMDAMHRAEPGAARGAGDDRPSSSQLHPALATTGPVKRAVPALATSGLHQASCTLPSTILRPSRPMQ